MEKSRNRGRNTKKETSRMLENLILRQEKTDEQIRQTYKMIEELKLRQEKTDEQIRQTYKMIEELKLRQEKTDEQLRETDRKIRETDRKIKEAIDEMRKRVGELTDSQGLFWESISEKGIKKFLEDRGYKIRRIIRHVEAKTSSGGEGEFDIIFEVHKDGEEEFFIVEIKATAHSNYINEFIEKLRSIFDFFPEFKGKKIWGVFSSGRYGDGTEIYAIKNRLITFGVSGEVVYVLNAPDEIKPFFG